MAIKFTYEGYLIYVAMAAYGVAAVLLLARARELGIALYLLGFAAAVAGVALRWCNVRHVPLQNLYEVFLFLGMLACPLSFFCWKFLRVGALAGDCLLGVIALFPAGLIFSGEPLKLPPALQSPLFAPHVAAYMAAYILMAKASVQAILALTATRPADPRLVAYERGTCAMIRLGFPPLTLGLILGAWWGKMAWGDYWNWDPKELWSFVSWLVYVGYLHFRYRYGARYPRANSALALAGMAAIVLTLLWVNLAGLFKGGLHSYAS